MTFMEGSAEEMPIESEAFSKIISVEAAQHFRNISAFLSEAYRVLKKDGKLAITTFFSTSSASLDELKTLIPTIRDDIDKVVPIEDVVNTLKQVGFKVVSHRSIGEEVWHGFDKWIAQGEMRSTWNTNWLVAYNKGLVDYYIITASKDV
jgi:cyclopropane fatty-acyl-phospholipid synthase-like methyltransferase